MKRGIRVSSFSEAVYSNRKKEEITMTGAEGEKGKDGKGRHADCDGRHRLSNLKSWFLQVLLIERLFQR